MNRYRSLNTVAMIFVSMVVASFVIFSLSAFAPAQEKIPVPPITAASLVVILAGALTMIADYFPGAAAWYDTLTPASKRVVMLVGAVLIVGTVFGGQCAGWFSSNMVCSPNGFVDVLSNIVLAFAVGQGVHAGVKPGADFKQEVLGINPHKASRVGI